MFTFILLISANSLNADVTVNRDKVIDSFEKYGQILEQSIEYSPNSPQPCYIKRQQLVQNQGVSVDLIDTYSESSFNEKYEDGHFTGTIDEIIAAVPVDEGYVVLTKSGLLQHLLIDKQVTKGQSLQLNLNHEGKAIIKYMPKSHALIILAHEQTLAIKLSNQTNIFENVTQQKIFEQFNVEQIHSIATINDMMFLAMGKGGVQMFQFKDKNLHSVSWNTDQQAVDTINNAVDIRVLQNSQPDIYFIYVLDKDVGVRQFTYNQVNTFIQQNKKLGTIPISGDIIDIHQNILMIIQFQKSHSLVNEIHLNFNENTYEERNQYKTFRDVRDIDILNHYVIILGKSGHQVLKHSLPKTYHNITQFHLIIPNLQQLDYQELKGKTAFFGVTKHRFFFSSFKELPSSIACYSNSTYQHVQFVYKQKSTRCPEQPEREYCEIEKNYTVNFVPPLNGAMYAELVLIYGVAGVLGLGFVLLVCLLWREYKKYEKCVYDEMVELPHGESEMSGSLDSKKFMKIPEQAQSPHSD